jgi:urate oxidase
VAADETQQQAAGAVLGPTRHGKSEVRLLHVARDGQYHEITDLNVSVALTGDQADTHLTGDNASVLTTDAQKNAVYALARRDGVAPVEEFGLRLGRHFAAVESIESARVRIERYGWRRIEAGGAPHPHSFERQAGIRIASVQVRADGQAEVAAGVSGLTLLKSTGSEFRGFLRDEFTTLAPATDRILATEVAARWRFAEPAGADWDASYAAAAAALRGAFAATYSKSLQQTLYAMGQAVIAACPELAEVRLSLPNKHHFLVDLGPFGMDNPGEVFYAADRPYGLIEGTVLRAGAAPGDPGHDW